MKRIYHNYTSLRHSLNKYLRNSSVITFFLMAHFSTTVIPESGLGNPKCLVTFINGLGTLSIQWWFCLKCDLMCVSRCYHWRTRWGTRNASPWPWTSAWASWHSSTWPWGHWATSTLAKASKAALRSTYRTTTGKPCSTGSARRCHMPLCCSGKLLDELKFPFSCVPFNALPTTWWLIAFVIYLQLHLSA